MTPEQVYRQSALNIAHGGVHLFQKGDEITADVDNVELYLNGKWTKHKSLFAAKSVWDKATHGAKRKDGAGYVRVGDAVTITFSQNGRMWRIAYLGRTGDKFLATAPATAALLGL